MSFAMSPEDAMGTAAEKKSCLGDAMCEFKKRNTMASNARAMAAGKSSSHNTVGGGVSGGANSMQPQPQQPSAYRIQEAERAAQAQKNNEAQAISMAEFARRVAEQDASMQNNPEKDLARGLEVGAQREQAKKDADRATKEELYNKEMKSLMSEQLRLAKQNDERNFALQVQQYNANQTINQNARNRSKQLQGGMRPGSTISGEDFKQFELKSENKNPFQFQPRKRK